jgi:acyl-CoA thioester hydrolase
MTAPSALETNFDASDVAAYAYWHEASLRFQDLDSLGHVTSISFLSLFETGRICFVRDAGHPPDESEFGWMLVNLNIDYKAQMQFPGTVRVGTRLKHVGRSSMSTIQALFFEGICTAHLDSTLVFVDRSTDGSSPIPDDLRQSMIQLSTNGNSIG